MSVYKQSIGAFASLIDSQIIPAEDLHNLLKVVEETPDDDEEIAIQIDNWLKPASRSEIKEVYRVNLINLPDSNPQASTSFGSLKIEDGQKSVSSKKLLMNSMRTAFGGAKMEPEQESESSKELINNTIKENTPEPKP